MELSDRIKFSRKRLGISQREFAKRLDTSQKVVYRWESGATPRGKGLERIAELTGIRLAWLANGEGEPAHEFKLTQDESRLIQHFRGITEKQWQYVARARMRFAGDYNKAERGMDLAIKTGFYGTAEASRKIIAGEMTRLLDDRFESLCRAYADYQAVSAEADSFGREKKIADPFQQAYKDIQKDIEAMASTDKEWILSKLVDIAEEGLEQANKLKAITNREDS